MPKTMQANRSLPPLTLKGEAGAIPITAEQFKAYINPQLTDLRGDLLTVGPWHQPVSYRAPAILYTWEDKGYGSSIIAVTLYGLRTMRSLRQSGYCLTGRLSIKGKTVKGFTSSQLWQLEDGRLIDTAVIHATKA